MMCTSTVAALSPTSYEMRTRGVAQCFHWSFLSYRYEEHAGADAEAAKTLEDPDALEVISCLPRRDNRLGL